VVLHFLSTTDVGRRGPADEGAVSGVLQTGLREWQVAQEADGLSAGGESPVFLPAPDFMASQEMVWLFQLTCIFVFCFVTSFVCIASSWDRPWWKEMGSFQRAKSARTAERKMDCT